MEATPTIQISSRNSLHFARKIMDAIKGVKLATSAKVYGPNSLSIMEQLQLSGQTDLMPLLPDVLGALRQPRGSSLSPSSAGNLSPP
jgi:hypothetical protein